MLLTELHTHRIPEVYRRFVDEIGKSHWSRRVADCKQEIRGNRFLRDFLEQENAIAFQLEKLGDLLARYGSVEGRAELQSLYPAAAFAAQILSLLDTWPAQHAERLKRRVHGAIKNPDDMRGLQLELMAANHFLHRSKTISWPEITGDGTFDLLVQGDRDIGLEVECKSFGDDKGRKISRREVLDFIGLLQPHLRLR